MDEPKLSTQLQLIVDRLKAGVPGFASVISQEELEEALKTTARLPAAVVIYAGDYPDRLDNANQAVKRYWSVVLVLDLQRAQVAGLDLIAEVKKTLLGAWLCDGVGQLALAGVRFVTTFDNTRSIYEVRFVQDAWLTYENP